MQIVKTQQDATLTLALEGRLDTLTSSQLDAEIQGKLDGITSLVFDFAKLAYLSPSSVIICSDVIRGRHKTRRGAQAARRTPQAQWHSRCLALHSLARCVLEPYPRFALGTHA